MLNLNKIVQRYYSTWADKLNDNNSTDWANFQQIKARIFSMLDLNKKF